MPSLSLLSFATLTVLARSTIAQIANSTTSSNETCKTPSYDVNAPVNASALVPVNITPEPWYLTVALNDTRTNTTARTWVYGWLSTPANSSSQACVYWMTDLLPAQSSGTPNGGCTGSLQDNCVDFIRRSIVLERSGNCPSLPSTEDFKKACPGSAFANGQEVVYTSAPFDTSNATCRDPRVPGANQTPSSYINHALFGVGLNGDGPSGAADPSNFTSYDEYVSQPMTWLVAAQDAGETKTSLLCVAPRDVAEGSRNVKTGGVARAMRAKGGWMGVVAVAVAAVVVV